jgi:hypothetical protein
MLQSFSRFRFCFPTLPAIGSPIGNFLKGR